MVINQLLTGMILQVSVVITCTSFADAKNMTHSAPVLCQELLSSSVPWSNQTLDSWELSWKTNRKNEKKTGWLG